MAASQEDQKEDREDVEIKVARQFFRVLNLISAIGLPSVCSEDTEVRYRCFPSGEHQTDDAKKRRGKFFVEIEERKRERESYDYEMLVAIQICTEVWISMDSNIY